MVRLPKPGGDSNIWGSVLNEFLSVEHNSDGTHKVSGDLATKADDSKVVHTTGAESIAGTKTFSAPLVVPAPTAPEHAPNKAYVDDGFLSKGGGALTGDLSLSSHSVTDVTAIRMPNNSGIEVRAANDVPLLQIAASGTLNTKDTPLFNDLGYAVTLAGTANSYIGLGNKTYLDGKAWTYGGWFDFTARNAFFG